MSHDFEKHAREIQSQGYTILRDALDAEAIAAARDALDELFEREKELGRERRWHNEVYKVAYMLPQKDPLFRTFPLNPRLLPLMRHLLGPNCVLASLNGLTMSSGGKKQALHIDQFESVPGALLYINALHTLDDKYVLGEDFAPHLGVLGAHFGPLVAPDVRVGVVDLHMLARQLMGDRLDDETPKLIFV